MREFGFETLFKVAFALLLLPVLAVAEARAEAGTQCSDGRYGQMQCIRPAHFVHDLFQALEGFAVANQLDPGFFARLIWQESRFDPNALSPAKAQGIAQFIAPTAALRGLRDPYNPAQALEYSARYLAEMSGRYGNPGLAAVGYNGGEARAERLIAGPTTLPRETRDYVRIITGLSAETWARNAPQRHDFRLDPDLAFQPACHALARKRRLTAYPVPEPDVPEWGVQLAFGTTKARARVQFRQQARNCAGSLRGETPLMIWQKSRASPKGGYFMARVGRNSRDAAWRLCARLKAEGCVCAVYRNR